ncbi:MAG TPA: molybdenum ABC transporter ATP-binding protein [Burkholderiales bacterium]
MSGLDVRLRARFGAFQLDVDFTAPGRGITALFGPSGAGKTSVLRCAAGLERAREGRLSLNGQCWQDEARDVFVPSHRRAIGYVFQETSLFPHFSVRGNLEYGWKRTAAGERRIAFEQAVEWLRLGPLLDRGSGTLSGGERQRVAIARALLTSPDLLLLDEPLSALDEEAKAEILPYLERLHQELSVPAVYVSHASDDVIQLADHIVLIEAGRVRAHGPLGELLTRVDLPFSRGDAAGCIIEAVAVEHEAAFRLTYVEFDGGRLAVPASPPIGACVRVHVSARDVSIALAPPSQSSILNVLPARVIDVTEHVPGRAVVRLAVGGAVLLARITQKSVSVLGLTPGQPVYAQIKSVALLH